MFNHPDSKTFQVFFKALEPENYIMMNLGKHFLAKYNSKDSNISLEIIKFIKKNRPNLELEQFVVKEEAYAKLDIILADLDKVTQQTESVEDPSQTIEETDDIKVEDDIQDDVYLKEPTTWAEVDIEDDELFQFLKEDNTDIDQEYTDDINFSQQIIPESLLGKSTLEAYNKKVNNMGYNEIFDQASQTVEKSVKCFLNQEYAGENQPFNCESVRPFIKTKNVLEQIYKLLFQMRSHDTINSVAKQATDDIKEKLSSLKERIDVMIRPLKSQLKELEDIK